jgi:gliding motility-associated-like protein
MLRQLLTVLLFLVAFATQATHNRAGEITFEYVGPFPALTYKITIITYTRTSSVQADRPSLDSVYFGDNSPYASIPRNSKTNLGNDISKNIYIGYHTYPGNGTFVIRFEDPNRNEGVVNIPNSIDVPFYIESTLIIDPYRFPNNSPILTYPPIDRGCVGRTFVHNANAFDPDGDSLSYELTFCRGAGGLTIPGYTYPIASSSFTLDPFTGDLVWDAPVQPGEYNVAFKIVSWRNGVNLGYVTRDMQILIADCNNDPPEFFPISDTCVIAEDTINFQVTAFDPNGNRVILSATGGPFEVADSARFTPIISNNDTVISNFNWATTCSLIRRQPYYVQFRAQDIVPFDSISLVSLKGVFIYIYGPPPTSLTAVAVGNHIDLNWTPTACSNVVGYRIYRRNGIYPDSIPCPCDNGAPSYTGYQLLDTTVGANATSYTDDDFGAGLSIGIEYCYIVTAIYADGAESCASPQACASLKKDLPVITNADVRTTSLSTGSVYVAWSKPSELDTLQFPSPYQYRLYRSSGFTAGSQSFIAAFNGLNDTTYIDSLFDTQSQPNNYQVELWYTNNGVLTRKGSSTAASTIFLTLTPSDNLIRLSWQEVVPWINDRYDIFRKNNLGGFDSIATVNARFYTDSNLVNGQTYCYFIRSVGRFSYDGFVDPVVNRSQQTCAVPVDNVPPCPPQLNVISSCEDEVNELIWTNPNNSCADDVVKYYIYYAPSVGAGYERIDSLLSPTDTTYTDANRTSLTGCYKVTAIDDVGNETINPVEVCVDSCRQYVLPSVFTPNQDGINDLFHPCDSTTSQELQQTNCPPYRNVKDIELFIFNRWGKQVFTTTDRDINWDGKDQESGAMCSDGVYYYTCKVNFYRLQGVETIDLHGTVQLLSGVK